MSFSTNRRDALDATMPLNHRASHLRSCALLIGEKWQVPRDAVIEAVKRKSNVNLLEITDEKQIQIVMPILEELRKYGLFRAQN